MKHSIKYIFYLPLSMVMCIAFAMDQSEQLIVTEKDYFSDMITQQDVGKIVVQGLSPVQINVLSKTSQELNTFFSFYNPSLKFLQCNNQCIHSKDYKSVFFASLYDRYYDKAEVLMHHEQQRILSCKAGGNHTLCKDRINNKYKIAGTGQALYPLAVAQASSNKTIPVLMPVLLKNYLESTVINNNLIAMEPHPLLIACISRNGERVEKILINNELDNTLNKNTVVSAALSIAVDVGDIQTLTLLLLNKNCEKHSNPSLIWQAIFCGHYASCEFLINNNLCGDINEKITSIVNAGTEGFTLMMQQLIGGLESTSTLLDLFQKNKELLKIKYGTRFICEVEMILLQNGAKTFEFLKAEEKAHIRPAKSVLKKMLNKVLK